MFNITAASLETNHTSTDQVALFRRTFGESAPLTPSVWALAQSAGFHVECCANLLERSRLDAYIAKRSALRAACDERVGVLWDAYKATSDCPWAYGLYRKRHAVVYGRYVAQQTAALYDALTQA